LPVEEEREKRGGSDKEQRRMRTIKRDWEVKRQQRGSGNVIFRREGDMVFI
jgi:hypothetical protein